MYTSTSYRQERDWAEIGLGCLGLLALIVILTFIGAFLTTIAWGLIVPAIFTSAVEMGALPASLTVVQALKLSILFAILGLTGASSAATKKKTSGSLGDKVLYGIIMFVVTIPILLILVVISGFFISLIWNWVVPDVFGGAVALGLMPAKMSLWHSILLSLLFSILGLTRKSSNSSSD